MPTEHLIKINNLSFGYNERLIFDDMDLNIPRGKIVAIMGPSGTGKTTLLRLIGAQLKPDIGTVHVNDQNIHTLSHKALFNARRDMGMLFQTGGLFTNLSVYQNVAFPLREHTKLPESMIRSLVLMKLNLVGLRGAKDLMPFELSGGMNRRVALARAVVLDPQLIMYDEPFAGQDPISMGVLVKLIKSLNETFQMTSIIVSHDVPETLSIADYVYVISNGKIIGEGSAEQIEKDESQEVKQFIQGLPDGPVPFHYPASDYQKELLEGKE